MRSVLFFWYAYHFHPSRAKNFLPCKWGFIQSIAWKKDSYLQDTTDFLNVIESKKPLKILYQSLWTLLVSTPTHHTSAVTNWFFGKGIFFSIWTLAVLLRVTTICRSEEPLAYQRRIRPEQKKTSNLDKTVDKGLKTKHRRRHVELKNK